MSQPLPDQDPRFVPGQAALSGATLLRAVSDHKTNLVDVPTDPLAAGRQVQALKKVRLDIESEHVLRLVPVPARPPWVARLTTLLLICCLFFLIFTGVQGVAVGLERQKQTTTIIWSCFTAFPVLILLGVIIIPLFKPGPPAYKFDNQTNLLTVERCVGLSKQSHLVATYSLDDAVALQLLYRFYKHCAAGMHSPGKSGSYEMNLVFRNSRTPRVNLAVHSDWQWMRQAGPRLAEFLDVSLLDQLCHD